MSILLKGMEMPKDGCHHTITIYSDGTVATGKANNYEAIEVPTPHGRLIDADYCLEKANQDFSKHQRKLAIRDGEEYIEFGMNYGLKGFNVCEQAVVKASTVIESEE